MSQYQCKKCLGTIPAMGLAPTVNYCLACRACAECGKELSKLQLDHCELHGISPMVCDDCLNPVIYENVVVRGNTITQAELDWLNRVNMIIQPNLALSMETNVNQAGLAAEASLECIYKKYANPEDSVTEIYAILKRIESWVGTYAVAIKHKRSEIKQSLEAKERTKYQSAMTASKRDKYQQCPKCKVKFLETEIAEHTQKCAANLTTKEKKLKSNLTKLEQSFVNIGFSVEEAQQEAIKTIKRANESKTSATTPTA